MRSEMPQERQKIGFRFSVCQLSQTCRNTASIFLRRQNGLGEYLVLSKTSSESARDAGVRTLERQAAALVLPPPDKAVQMTESGVPVETAQDGYDLKADQVRLKLPWLKLDDRSLLFFNSAEDDPEALRAFLRRRIARSPREPSRAAE